MSKTTALPFKLEIKHDLHPRSNLDFLQYLPGNYTDGKVKVSYAKLTQTFDNAIKKRMEQVYERLAGVLDHYPISKITIYVILTHKNKWDFKKTAEEINISITKNEIHEILGAFWHPMYRDQIGYEYHIDERLVTSLVGKKEEGSFFYNNSFIPLGMMLTQLLKFKAQGTSELVNFLRGIGQYRDFKRIKARNNKMIPRLKHANFEDPDWKINFSYTVHDEQPTWLFGPVMILHALYVNAEKQNNSLLRELINRVKVHRLKDDEVNSLILESLKLSHIDFLVNLTKPGYEQEVFWEGSLLLDLLAYREGEDLTDKMKALYPKHFLNEEPTPDHEKVKDTYENFYAAFKRELGH